MFQVLNLTLDQGHSFSFVYIRSTPLASEALWLAKNTNCSSFLLGDLNLNPNEPPQMRMVDVVRGKRNIYLKEATNKNRKNIDHIFGDSDHLYFCQAFLNFISDHFTITLRIALSSTSFVDDDRLGRNDTVLVTNTESENVRRKKNQIKIGQAPKKQRSVED